MILEFSGLKQFFVDFTSSTSENHHWEGARFAEWNASAAVGALDTPGEAYVAEVVNGFAYVGDGDSGLRIIDVSDPTLPVEVGALTALGYASDVDVGNVDVTTLAFGPIGAPIDHSQGPHFEDLNGDGFTDLMAHFRIEETGIAFGEMEACVTGEGSYP